MSYAYRCGVCDDWASWRVTRIGDVVEQWACNQHLARVSLDLQRAHERTELAVTLNEHHPV